MNEIIKYFMREEGLSKEDAKVEFERMRREVRDGADPEELLYEIGLEPDYVMDLL